MSTTTYPPGGTFFDTLKKSFADVHVDKEHGFSIPTGPFLEAAESLTTLFGISGNAIENKLCLTELIDVLGSVAFTPVKTDMLGNIKV